MAGQQENSVVCENGVNGTSSDGEPTKLPSDVPQETAEEPREPTLTDHLNKKLLQSFLTRLDGGNFNFPDSSHSKPNNNDEADDFDD